MNAPHLPAIAHLAVAIALPAAIVRPLDAQETSPPRYAIGSIPDQRIWFNAGGSELVFDVAADGLGPAPTISATYDESQAPAGLLTFDPDLDRLRYVPDAADARAFDVTFLGVGSGPAQVQTVRIEPLQPLPPEQEAFGIDPDPSTLPDPESRDYLLVEDRPTGESVPFNAGERVDTRSVTIIGKRVVFENGHPNGLHESLHGVTDLRDLEIQAETVVFRDSLHLPQTKVTLRAIHLAFEDRDGAEPTTLSTTPLPVLGGSRPPRVPTEPQPKAEGGHPGGSLVLRIRDLDAPGDAVRFVTTGGAGRDARPGKEGQDLGTITAISRTYSGRDLGSNYVLFLWVERAGILKDQYSPSEKAYWDSTDWDGNSLLRDGSGRFRANPGTPGGVPGDGGAGGDVTSTLDLGAVVDQGGGPAGAVAPTAAGGRGVRVEKHGGGSPRNFGYRVKVETDTVGTVTRTSRKEFTSPDGAPAPGPPAEVPIGPQGTLAVVPDDAGWLAPAALRTSLAHLNDAYLEGHLAPVDDELAVLVSRIDEARESPGWEALPADERDDLTQLRDDMMTLRHRIGTNLDFFGNPAGWVPMLSFEVNKLAFDEEIDRAMRVIYLNYWLGRRAEDIGEARDAMRAMRDELLAQVEADRDAFDEAVLEIPAVEADADDLQVAIDDTIRRIREIEEALLPKAKNVAALKKTARTLGRVAQMIPVYQPALGTAGGAVAAAADIDPDKSWEENAILVGEGAAGGFAAGNALAKASAAKAAADGIDTGAPEGNAAAAAALQEARGPLLDLLAETYDSVTGSKAPDPEVAAELERLLADAPEYRVLSEDLDQLNVRKREFVVRLSELIQEITVLPIAISRNLRTVDRLNTEIREANRRLDPATLAYLHDMDRRARARLLKYHYYVARAYSYRRLEAYPGRLDLNRVFDKFSELSDPARTDGDPAGPTLNAADFDSLKAVYEEQVSTVAEKILDDANQNPSERSIAAVFDLPAGIVAALNAGDEPRINLKDLNLFPTSEENLRITDLFVKAMEIEFDPSFPAPRSADLVIRHSGISELQREGRTFLFRHDNRSARSLIEWKTRHQFADGSLVSSRPSAASRSLIAALVPDAENLLIYSRPAARADLVLTLDSSATPGAVVRLVAATLEVRYDYTEKSRFLRSLAFLPGDDGFEPQIEVDTADRNDRSTGRGDFERTYDVNRTVTVEAPAIVGDLRFVRWEGAMLADPTSRTQTVTLDRNIVLQPIYEPATTYTLTVVGGLGGGVYFPGEIVTITADAPAPGRRFAEWTGGHPADPLDAVTTIPVFGDETVTARFEVVPGDEGATLTATALGDGTLALVLTAAQDETWVVEESADGSSWMPSTTIDLVDGAGSAVVPIAGPRKFFRAVRGPAAR